MKKLLHFIVLYLTSGVLSTLFAYEVVVATMFHNEGDYLKEWIEYHRMIGVDHFWMYNDRSSDQWEEVLGPYIKEGLVEVFDWPIPNVENVFLNEGYVLTQCLAFKDALKRGVGVAKWVAFIDLDEFILPVKGSSLPECLDKYFQNAQAVYINWRCFGTGGVSLPKGHPILFQLTASSLQNHPRNCVGKTIVRPEAALSEMLWSPHFCSLKQGAQYHNGDGQIISVDGPDLKTDGYTHMKFIRINHYVMRDENYFQNVRLERARKGYNGYKITDEKLLLEHNHDFSIVKDSALTNFIKKYYPQMCDFWVNK